jgi:hypothetical protein
MMKTNYWFSTKKYGWGWGLPNMWQGWVAYAVATLLLVAGPFLFSPTTHMFTFQLYMWGVALCLVAVCWLKGEPPRWRWGK